MVINGHRVERKITSHDLLGAVDGPASWRPGEGAHGKRKTEGASAVLVGARLCLFKCTRTTQPRPTGDLQTINGFGVFVPKSVSGSGEAVFSNNMRYIGGIDALVGGRNLAWKFMVLEVVPPQWVRSHALACPHA